MFRAITMPSRRTTPVGAPVAQILPLGPRPTPVEPLDPHVVGAAGLWIKRDDLSSPVYGGNKVRKLERFFARARAEGKTRLLTMGAAGSNQLVAMSRFAGPLGFSVRAVVVSQPRTARGEKNLRVALAHGLEPIACASWTLATGVLAAHGSPDTFIVPLGGSSVVGSLGFVDAAFELARQVASGAMPVPDEIVVPLGSGGTAAGLAVGLEEARLRTRVTAVAVAGPVPAVSMAVARLAWATARARGLDGASRVRAARRVRVTGAHLGAGYGHPSVEGTRATETAARLGLLLDDTYTAKAFACALAHARASREGVVLFWHTLSSRPLPDVGGALPARLDRLFL